MGFADALLISPVPGALARCHFFFNDVLPIQAAFIPSLNNLLLSSTLRVIPYHLLFHYLLPTFNQPRHLTTPFFHITLFHLRVNPLLTFSNHTLPQPFACLSRYVPSALLWQDDVNSRLCRSSSSC